MRGTTPASRARLSSSYPSMRVTPPSSRARRRRRATRDLSRALAGEVMMRSGMTDSIAPGRRAVPERAACPPPAAATRRAPGDGSGHRCWVMLRTAPSGSRTKNRRNPHSSSVRG